MYTKIHCCKYNRHVVFAYRTITIIDGVRTPWERIRYPATCVEFNIHFVNTSSRRQFLSNLVSQRCTVASAQKCLIMSGEMVSETYHPDISSICENCCDTKFDRNRVYFVVCANMMPNSIHVDCHVIRSQATLISLIFQGLTHRCAMFAYRTIS